MQRGFTFFFVYVAAPDSLKEKLAMWRPQNCGATSLITVFNNLFYLFSGIVVEFQEMQEYSAIIGASISVPADETIYAVVENTQTLIKKIYNFQLIIRKICNQV